MSKIAVVTATRAEYGLLSPVIRELRKRECDDLRIELIVTGAHLSEEYGSTINEIKERIDHIISIPVANDKPEDISNNQAETLKAFSTLFAKEKYDALCVLGDRYEMLAIAIVAGNMRTPVFHLCGGDTTEGAMDEWIRHSITKISYLHFVTNEDSRKRVIQLGENPERVFNFGSTSVDNILSIADLNKLDALNSIGLEECRYALCTYHPVTMDDAGIEQKIEALLDAIGHFSSIQFIVTKANADIGGAKINELLDEAEEKFDNVHVFASLGAKRYLSLMKYAEFVLGNSSSGIIETPSFQIPTVNIGDRQKGRLQPESIINCGSDKDDIISAIDKALSKEFRDKCRRTASPYGNGDAAQQIAKKIIETVAQGKIDLKKKFYDL
ncbi:GDP/UDP-N,N'-diacetylbacillosamine 2-epimerase (hydrolysing) [Lachnospiraceae bacterium C10]|nr:GDP/UDP-N,N'-diacetylbacillosamine 2-epimerase (hydrolysing) [Lachnospiraceae bacterium C10]